MSGVFVEAFQHELEKTTKKIPDSYEGTRGRPLILPAMPTTYVPPPLPQTQTVSVVLKSIRSPRFTVTYEIPDRDSIFSVKERLVSDPNGPFASVETPVEAIRLVLQGRALSDTHQLKELPACNFIVMVKNDVDGGKIGPPVQYYWGHDGEPVNPASTSVVEETESTVQPPATNNQKPGINMSFWNEVEELAGKYVDDPVEVVKTMRQSYDSSSLSSTLELD